jgi:hypothetical protein
MRVMSITLEKPALFRPDTGPVGCEIRFVTFLEDRPRVPNGMRLILGHTNAAQREGSIASAWNWAHAKPNSNTCPHYQVDRNGNTRKMLPSNRRAIANATVNSVEGAHGDVAWFSIAIETADSGTLADPSISAFTPAQIDAMVAIYAYESIVHPQIKLAYPTEWWGAGSAAHTEPFGYPYWTLYNGKICPGNKKKQQIRDIIIPRARELRARWLGETTPPPPPPPPTGDRRAPIAPLRRGDQSMEVALLINYLKEFAWYPAEWMGDTNDATYGARCEAGVRNMQQALRIGVDGFYGSQSQGALQTFLTPPPPPPTVPPPVVGQGEIVDLIDYGWFQLHDGVRWPYSVAQAVYGVGELYPWIVNFNGFAADLSNWPGEGGYVKVPSLRAGVDPRLTVDRLFAGVRVRTGIGQAPAAVIGTAYPNESFQQRQARVAAWVFWNGGDEATFPGEVVFCPA